MRDEPKLPVFVTVAVPEYPLVESIARDGVTLMLATGSQRTMKLIIPPEVSVCGSDGETLPALTMDAKIFLSPESSAANPCQLCCSAMFLLSIDLIANPAGTAIPFTES